MYRHWGSVQSHRGIRGIALLFFDHGTRRGWEVSLTPRPLFTPRERPSTHCTGGWVGPGPVRTGAENLAPPGFDLRTVQPVASRFTDWSTPAHNVEYSPYFVRFFRSEYYRHPIGRLTVNYLDTLSGASWWIFLDILSGVLPSIISIFIWMFVSQRSQHILRRFTNDISRQFYPDICRVSSTFCLSSLGKFFSISCQSVSGWISSIYWRTSLCKLSQYFVGRYRINIVDILSLASRCISSICYRAPHSCLFEGSIGTNRLNPARRQILDIATLATAWNVGLAMTRWRKCECNVISDKQNMKQNMNVFLYLTNKIWNKIWMYCYIWQTKYETKYDTKYECIFISDNQNMKQNMIQNMNVFLYLTNKIWNKIWMHFYIWQTKYETKYECIVISDK